MKMSSNQVCRICLLGCEQTVLTHIFGNKCFHGLEEKLQKCLPFRINIMDSYPKYICYKCLAQLDVVYEFLSTALRSNVYLKKNKEAESNENVFPKSKCTKYPHMDTNSISSMKNIEGNLNEDDLIVNRYKGKMSSKTTQHRSVVIKYTRQDTCSMRSGEHSASSSLSPEDTLINQEETKEICNSAPESHVFETKPKENIHSNVEIFNTLTSTNTSQISNSMNNNGHIDVVTQPLEQSDENINGTKSVANLFPQPIYTPVPMLPYPSPYMWYQFPPRNYPPGLQVANTHCYPTIPTPQPIPIVPKMEPPNTYISRSMDTSIQTEPLGEVKKEIDDNETRNRKQIEIHKEGTNVQVNRESNNDELNTEKNIDPCTLTKIKVEMQSKSPHTPRQSSEVSSNSSTIYFGESYSLDVNYCKECRAILSPTANLFQHLLTHHPGE